MSDSQDNPMILRDVYNALLRQDNKTATRLIQTDYPFTGQSANPRTYSEKEKMSVFLRDGFIDRYTGQKLVFIGALRLLSFLMPEVFPYHPNWKIEQCHMAYWHLTPTLDHIVPVSRGGEDQFDNWVTTSMLTNARKANWTLKELEWSLLRPAELNEWDGLVSEFVDYVEANNHLLDQSVIKKYYKLAKQH